MTRIALPAAVLMITSAAPAQPLVPAALDAQVVKTTNAIPMTAVIGESGLIVGNSFGLFTISAQDVATIYGDYASASADTPTVNDSDRIAFTANATAGPGDGAFAVMGSTVTNLAVPGQSGPGGIGTIRSVVSVGLDAASDTVIHATLDATPGGTLVDDSVIFGDNGMIARAGQAAPGLAGDRFVLFDNLNVAAGGGVVFEGFLSNDNGGVTRRQVFLSSGGMLLRVSADQEFAGAFEPVTNDAGAVAFSGFQRTNGNFSREGIFVAEALAAGGFSYAAVATVADGYSGFGSPQLNELGDVAVVAEQSDGTDVLLVTADHGAVTRQLSPGGTIAGVAFNDVGQAAFLQDDVLFAFDPRLGLFEVTRVAGAINGLVFTTDGSSRDGLNNAGQITFGTGRTIGGGELVAAQIPDVADLLPGDANLDDTVSILDFAVLRANFGSDDGFFTTGDFNGDGVVSILDFAILRANFGGSQSQTAAIDSWAATVPEPTGLAMSIGLTAIAVRRTRR